MINHTFTTVENLEHNLNEACVGKGATLKAWIEKTNNSEVPYVDCKCPLLVLPYQLSSGLPNDVYWSFARGFDNSGSPNDPLTISKFYKLGQKFRARALAGDFD